MGIDLKPSSGLSKTSRFPAKNHARGKEWAQLIEPISQFPHLHDDFLQLYRLRQTVSLGMMD